jgi:hypothetical protein
MLSAPTFLCTLTIALVGYVMAERSQQKDAESAALAIEIL